MPPVHLQKTIKGTSESLLRYTNITERHTKSVPFDTKPRTDLCTNQTLLAATHTLCLALLNHFISLNKNHIFTAVDDTRVEGEDHYCNLLNKQILITSHLYLHTIDYSSFPYFHLKFPAKTQKLISISNLITLATAVSQKAQLFSTWRTIYLSIYLSRAAGAGVERREALECFRLQFSWRRAETLVDGLVEDLPAQQPALQLSPQQVALSLGALHEAAVLLSAAGQVGDDLVDGAVRDVLVDGETGLTCLERTVLDKTLHSVAISHRIILTDVAERVNNYKGFKIIYTR